MDLRPVVLSGIRATGRLHIGNYMGVLKRFAEYSHDRSKRCYYFIADLHTLTTIKDAKYIKEHLPEIALDFLAAGVDPDRATIYVQSSVPETSELNWILACMSQYGELQKMPTFKEKVEKHHDDVNVGLFTYPVLMAADILGPRATLVPVGKDQKAHLEFTRKIARRFNHKYGEIFPVPDAIRDWMISVPGLSSRNDDGTFPKMGKSDKNTLNLNETEDEMFNKLRITPTDPARVRRRDQGTPELCSIYYLQYLFADSGELETVITGCRNGYISCFDCKRMLSKYISRELGGFRERREEIKREDIVQDILVEGGKHMRRIVAETLNMVKDCVGLNTE